MDGWCLITGLDYWTGLLDWTTGLTFYHKISLGMLSKKECNNYCLVINSSSNLAIGVNDLL